MNDNPINAKVASIINETDLALNKGAEDGVEEGMKFAILSDAAEEILDPDTGDILDSIPVAKTLVKIVHAASRSSIGRTFRKHESAGIFNAFGQGSTRYEILESDESRIQQELDPKEAKVKKGDWAVEYTGEYSGIVYDF